MQYAGTEDELDWYSKQIDIIIDLTRSIYFNDKKGFDNQMIFEQRHFL